MSDDEASDLQEEEILNPRGGDDDEAYLAFVKPKKIISLPKDSPFICFNFRTRVRWLSKDSLICVPYLQQLVASMERMTPPPMDENGNILVDESSSIIKFIIDKYRAWLEDNQPTSYPGDATVRSVARRMGCDPQFIKAMERKEHTEKDCFKCYYCGNVYLKGSKRALFPCTYHRVDCVCRRDAFSSRKCAEIPFHSETELFIAPTKL